MFVEQGRSAVATDCVFCKIVQSEIPSCTIYQDAQVYAFLDIGPVSPGHCLVIPRDHYADLVDCPGPILAALARRLGPLARAIVKATGADGYNVLSNNGRAAGQLVEHVHFHIIPRRQGDGLLAQWPAGQYASGRMEALAGEIKRYL